MNVARHRTALFRTDLSRPLRTALADGVLGSGSTVMDYGCGRGGDVRQLREAGFDCTGWDPVHAPEGDRRRADVVNLGYIVNVIEDRAERSAVLGRAWSLAKDVLVVSARLVDERPSGSVPDYRDGFMTRLGTFQKFYEQQELRAWIDATLDVQCVAAAPGVFYVFRLPETQARFAASRFRRVAAQPRLRASDRLLAEHRDLLDALAAFLSTRGRLPEVGELPEERRIVDALGGFRRAHRLLLSISDDAAWDRVRRERSEDLLLYLALSRFDARPRIRELPLEMQGDVRAFFGSHAAACREADALLFSLGRQDVLEAAIRAAPFGKLLPTALYVHLDAIGEQALTLRLYEGCARATLGAVDGATIVKFRRDEPKVSYLCYPEFETDPHPALAESVSIHLQTFRTKTRRYADAPNPPVLHRKETFVSPQHPQRARFARLTESEVRAGLLDDKASIGTRQGWSAALRERGLCLRGHRLIRDSRPFPVA